MSSTRVLPQLSTARLELRPAGLTDVDALQALWAEPLVRRFLWDDREVTREMARAQLEEALAQDERGLGLWTLWPHGAPRLMGCAGLLPASTAAQLEPRLAGMIEPVVALAPTAWKRGYAHEALMELLRHARDELGLAELCGVTDVPNVDSDRMLRRAGFEPLGECDGPKYRLRTYLWRSAR